MKHRYRPDMMRFWTSSTLRKVPRAQWPAAQREKTERVEVWLSARFIVQVFDEPNGVLRASVNLVEHSEVGPDGTPLWHDGITWEDLMLVKAEIGRSDAWAVEVYPPDAQVINVANMRHLWILPEPPTYGWHPTPKGS